jgi:hypothetical protein
VTTTLPETTLLHEDENGKIVVTDSSVPYDDVVAAYDRGRGYSDMSLSAKVFAHDAKLSYLTVVLLFRYIRHNERANDEQCDTEADEFDDYDYRSEDSGFVDPDSLDIE